MAASMIIRSLGVARNGLFFSTLSRDICCHQLTATALPILTIAARNYSFISKVTADQLWEGVTSVSNAGRKRGRGRNVKRKVDLNRGQRLGQGKSGLVFPGLTGNPIMGNKLIEIHQASRDDKEDAIDRPAPTKKRTGLREPALLRGYSGRKYPGTSIGAPDPIHDYEFEGFDTKVLEYKMVSHMTGNLGRKMRVSALVVTGNKNGLAGYAVAKAPMGRAALRKAKNMAAQRLQFVERYNGHTVFHNFAVKEGSTTVFVQKMPKGAGLSGHRVVKTICEALGLEDLHIKVEGRTSNYQNITKAFFRGLSEQETHQQLADRLKLHVVEYRPELEYLPVPVASPSEGVTRPEPLDEEAFDFENLYYSGKIPLKKIEDPMKLHTQTPARWKAYLKQHRDRNQFHARYLRMIHGLEPSKEEVKRRMRPLK